MYAAVDGKRLPSLAREATMAEYLLKPVPTADDRLPTIDLRDPRPFAIGNGAHDYLCGTCGNVLLSKVDMPSRRMTVICGKCRGANVTERAL